MKIQPETAGAPGRCGELHGAGGWRPRSRHWGRRASPGPALTKAEGSALRGLQAPPLPPPDGHDPAQAHAVSRGACDTRPAVLLATVTPAAQGPLQREAGEFKTGQDTALLKAL